MDRLGEGDRVDPFIAFVEISDLSLTNVASVAYTILPRAGTLQPARATTSRMSNERAACTRG